MMVGVTAFVIIQALHNCWGGGVAVSCAQALSCLSAWMMLIGDVCSDIMADLMDE